MFSIDDYREEFFVRLYRCWLIVNILGNHKDEKRKLTIQKAAFFDFLIRNPKSLHEFLVRFKKISNETPYKNILYSNNISHGAFQDHSDFLRSALILESEGYIKIVKHEDDFFVEPTAKALKTQEAHDPAWILSIELLKPLVGKSLKALYNGILNNE